MENSYTNCYIASQKETYILKFKSYIRLNNTIVDVLNNAKEIIKSFDGKVLNKRIIKVLNGKIFSGEEFNGCCFSLNKDEYSQTHHINVIIGGRQREIFSPITHKFMGYLNYYESVIDVHTDSDNRIIANETLSCVDKIITEKQKAISEHLITIENFDKYTELSGNIEKEIAKYKKEVPQSVQLRISILQPWDI